MAVNPYDRVELGLAQLSVISAVGADADVLELGCSSGYMTAAMLRNGCRVTAVDVDAHGVEQARPYAQRAYVHDLNQPLSEERSSSYDRVVAADILEHLTSPLDRLQEMRTLLRPGGRLILSVPNIAYWEVRLELLRGRFDRTEVGILDEGHLHFWTSRSACQLLASGGFTSFQVSAIPHRVPFDHQLRRLSERQAIRLTHRCIRRWPELMAYQLVIEAVPERSVTAWTRGTGTRRDDPTGQRGARLPPVQPTAQ